MQVDVAHEMIAWPLILQVKQENTVLQLNMGEGKTSVIVPLVAAALADGSKLTRVIVLKALCSQMFQLLIQRLSGLANRRIFYMPFSRDVQLGDQQVKLIKDMFEDCEQVGGILVAQPKHILSFKLMGIDRFLGSKSPTDQMLELQRWLDAHSRDILDESDTILHVRYQLVYTVGDHRLLEGHPNRWEIVQYIFSLVAKHALEVYCRYPEGVEYQDEVRGRFPEFRILQDDAGKFLVELIARDIMDDKITNHKFSDPVCDVARRMIFDINASKEDVDLVAQHHKNQSKWKELLLLRGLVAHNILLYTLKGRQWRVDYGLNLSQSMLAVPYRAKDVPASRAEFAHPDVATALTCLSYYYNGLSENQLDSCFEVLKREGHQDVIYKQWVAKVEGVPDELGKLNRVDPTDPDQRSQILHLFKDNQAVVDFYLSRVVFPQQAKEFPERIATTGWDIAEAKAHITTGFSGTNDNRYLLPTSINQKDPQFRLSTNAKVLSYLLQPENKYYLLVPRDTDQSATKSFIHHLVMQAPEIRILLDVGAQMLEYQNAELAKYWLKLKTEVLAVVYFQDDDLVVLSRDGVAEPFITSPFNQQLDKCLVYLDDVHTRGTDLKLPGNSWAAVTLGPKVTKDRLLQGSLIWSV